MRWLYVLIASTALAQTVPAPAPPREPAHTPTAAELMRSSLDKQRAAIALQQEATRNQAKSAGATMVPWSPAPSIDEAPCEPLAADVVTPLIESAAKSNNLEVKLVRAMIERESGFRACAVSSKGAQGLMQLMPETAGDLQIKDVFDPKENIAAGAKYLRQLLDKYKGDNKLALAAYNAGPAAVDAAKGVPDIAETRDYVEAILKKLQ